MRTARPLLLALLLLAAPAASAADPAPAPAADEAKAVISLAGGQPVPREWPAGFSVELSSASSVAGSLPRSVRWTIDPAWIDQLSPRRDGGKTVSVGTGTRPKTIAVKLQVARGDTFDETSVTIRVVANPDDPEPTPEPTPPAPGPVPPGPPPAPPGDYDPAFVPLGKALGAQFGADFGKALEDGARLLDAGQGRDAADGAVQQGFAANRQASFARIVGTALDKVVPPDRPDAQLTPADRAALARAYRGLRRGAETR